MGDSPVRPDPAATVIVLRPARSQFELLMVRRLDRGAFAGLVVFPGGRVDRVDDSHLARTVVNSDGPDHPFRAAALRELAEETGMLAAPGGLVPAPALRDEALYLAVNGRGQRFDGSSLVLISRWVTPTMAKRRFDTWFYLLATSGNPDVRLDQAELTDHAWVTPAMALDRYKEGEWPMILPTLAHLRWLSRRDSIDDALAAASGADGRTLIEPRLLDDGSLMPVHLPADPT